ncbi:MAG TPA: DUF362 domain-containing protein [bacterium]|nr:DUF362 domain-containing protein [bacterium]HPJ71092.1 DUF362 domain-containing protein [bacterium]
MKDYPGTPPFDPPEVFPELERLPFRVGTDPGNRVYSGVRETLKLLGLDRERFGTREWNPLGELIRPGNKVVIKPNFALHYHRGGETPLSIVVHASVLRPLIDYAQLALQGSGELLVADAPVTDADWEKLIEVNRVRPMLEILNRSYPLRIGLRDLRRVVVSGYDQNNLFLDRRVQGYGARHTTIVNLGKHSAFYGLPPKIEKLYYGADFDRRIPQAHHRGEIQEYSVAADILEADVVICVPKLKTHKTAGVTLSVKNIVGINTDKNFLPHYRIGEPRDGGDEYPDTGGQWLRWKGKLVRTAIDIGLGRLGSVVARPLNRLLNFYRRFSLGERAADPTIETADLVYKRLLGRRVRCGHWYGNDTLWRLGVDLNRVLLYADRDGVIHETPRRSYLSLMDGIIAGEGKGPMVPDPRHVGVLIAGFNPLAVDRVAVGLMGFDEARLPIVAKVASAPGLSLGGSRPPEVCLVPGTDLPHLAPFEPAPNWKGHIERGMEQRA